jgi:hypothetical protein
MLGSASDVARRLDHGWVGTEHFLLALLTEPSLAAEALADVDVTSDRVVDALQGPTGLLGPNVQHYSPERGLSPNPAAYKLEGRAEGLALAWGFRSPSRNIGSSPWSTKSMAW